MFTIPASLQERFEAKLRDSDVPEKAHLHYLRWLRFYLDFCLRYDTPSNRHENLSLYLQKLRERKQADWQLQQASHAVSLFYELLPTGESPPDSSRNEPVPARNEASRKTSGPGIPQRASSASKPFRPAVATPRRPIAPAAGNPAAKAGPEGSVPLPHVSDPVRDYTGRDAPASTTRGASWQAEFAKLNEEIKLRHYSRRTLQTYRHWVRGFQTFVRSKPPEALDTADVKGYLTWLAVKKDVSASTQNQAFNALLFFFRHVLGREFGKVDGVVRAKRRPFIPTVLSREEIDEVLAHLAPPHDLVVKMLYGCGLRLTECLELRVHCLNFDTGMVTVYGKGKRSGPCRSPKR